MAYFINAFYIVPIVFELFIAPVIIGAAGVICILNGHKRSGYALLCSMLCFFAAEHFSLRNIDIEESIGYAFMSLSISFLSWLSLLAGVFGVILKGKSQ